MDNFIDVAIIGAGPYGLSLAAYLGAAKIDYRIFGKTMETWKEKMPPGMLLKSHPWATSLCEPASCFTLKQFCAEHRIPYHDYLISISLQHFIEYGEAFQARFVPNVENKRLISIERSHYGLQTVFDDGEVLNARKVVIAIGVHPFQYVPPNLSHLPPDVLSHSSKYGLLEAFKGKEVAILGSGASATDLAVLLHKNQAAVSLVARTEELPFMPQPEAKRIELPTLRRLAAPLKPLKKLLSPNSCIGSTWFLKICANAPYIYHSLPQQTRLEIVKNELGPSGHWAFKNLVQDHISLHLGRNIESIDLKNNKINLYLTTGESTREIIQADHLIAATGYKIDLSRLDFLDKILPHLQLIEKAPVLSSNYESTLPGLYFIGPASANCFGPVTRFVCGAIHPARRITEHLLCTSKIGSYPAKPILYPHAPGIKKTSPNVLMISALFRTPYRALRCAQAAGANVYVLGSQTAKGLKTSRYCKAFISTNLPINGKFDAELAEQINQLVVSLGIDIILAGDTASSRSLIAIRNMLKAPCFPMPDLEQFDLLNNKWDFYQLCQSLGIKCPYSKLFQDREELTKEISLDKLTFPQVAKPIDKEAGIGYVKFDNQTAKKQLEKITYHPVMVQDFIEGEDLGASVFCQNGKILAFIAHTFRRYTYEAFFDQDIYNSINKITSHLKLDGIFNFDMRRTSDGQIYYLECNPRVFWKISMSMLAGMNFISYGIFQLPNNAFLRPTSHIRVRFPKATMLLAATSPWKLDKSSLDVLKYQYRDPIPYLREIVGLENDIGGNY